MRLLLDEMYPPALAERLRSAGIETATANEIGLAGSSDADLFAAAVEQRYTLLTENVADFTRIAAEHATTGRHHCGVLIALSSRFSRRPGGLAGLAAAVGAVADQKLDDRAVFLQRTERD